MNKHMIAAIVSTIPLAAAATASTNNDKQDEIWVAGFVEQYFADRDKFTEAPQDRINTGYGFEVGKRFKPEFGARLEWAKIELDSYPFPGLQDISGYRWGADAMYFPDAGQTYLFTGVKQEKLHEDFNLLNLGIGHQWEVSDKWNVITEFAAYHDFGEAYKDYSFKLGLAYIFPGSEAKAAPKPSPIQAAPAAPSAPVDSDKDGVIDSQDKCPGTASGTTVDASGCEVVLDSDNDGVVDSADKCPNSLADDRVDSDGCTIFSVTQTTVTLAINFANDSSVVKTSDHDELARFADMMKRYTDINVEIEGHSSAVGSAQYNLGLSQRRADAVKTLLVEKYDVDADRLTAVGYGETRLLDSANTAEAHKKNRRISASVVVEDKVREKQ